MCTITLRDQLISIMLQTIPSCAYCFGPEEALQLVWHGNKLEVGGLPLRTLVTGGKEHIRSQHNLVLISLNEVYCCSAELSNNQGVARNKGMTANAMSI